MVDIVAAMPLSAGEPATWVTSSAPTDRTEPIPSPASTCPAMSTARTRVRMRATSTAVVIQPAYVGASGAAPCHRNRTGPVSGCAPG